MLHMLFFTVLLFTCAQSQQILVKDPEEQMNTPQIIQYWKYPVEEHQAVTKDGYILKMYRIPHGRSLNAAKLLSTKPVVFIQHGLLSSCVDWISNLPHESAPFIFADAGFDVWLGNFRGNTYGKQHLRLSPNSQEFWQFSWDQMAEYDLPAMVKMALNVSGANHLYYMGHSEGTLTMFAKLSTDKKFAKKIKHVFALGPVSKLGHIKGFFSYLAKLTSTVQLMTSLFGEKEFLPQDKFLELMAAFFCRQYVIQDMCKNILFMIAGPDSRQLNVTRLPVYLSHTPSGTSTRNMVHFGQMINSDKFQKYDFGSAFLNLYHYGRLTPPLYDVGKITVPVSLFWSAEDWLADPQDVAEGLVSKLKTLFSSHFLQGFNHLDYMWGINATEAIYNVIRDEIYNDIVYSADKDVVSPNS
ncbi:unnamed protein product [Soboliphyme baturini]|uniref:Lipase n=1 Tax=Soboliphyme baturini TaxID=241478 RepID=A0A183IX21_9BILA|nr:unnamed protein product [Soboliphyme baturini]